MKRHLSIIAIAIAALTSCSKNVEPAAADGSKVLIDASFATTKTALEGNLKDGFKASWAAGDKIKVFQNNVGVDSDALKEAGATAQFTATLPSSAEAQKIYSAVYPASAVAKASNSWTITLPATQTSAGGSFDPAADILVSKLVTLSEQPKTLPMNFARLGSVIRISVKGLAEGETVQQVVITSDGALLAGTWQWNALSAEAETNTTGSSSVTVNSKDSVVVARVLPATTEGFSVALTTSKRKYAKVSAERTVFAENTVNCYTFDISNAGPDLEGEGTQSNPFVIKTADHMAAVGGRLILGETTYFVLANDIDLSGIASWTPVNMGDADMRIDFDGKGYKISGMKCSAENYPSLFGVLAGEVRNLNLDGCQVVAAGQAGILAAAVGKVDGSFKSTVKNVKITNSSLSTTANLSAQAIIGGLAGRLGSGSSVTDCTFEGTVTNNSSAAASYTGGLIGETNNASVVSGVTVKATVKSTNKSRYTGGIIANSAHAINLTNSSFEGSVTAAYDIVGGAVGYTLGGTVKNVTVNADVTAGTTPDFTGSNYYSYAGGVIGWTYYSSAINYAMNIDQCSFNGKIKASGKVVGGIIGQISQQSTVTNCKVEGTMEARQFAAGICGYIQRIGGTIKDCDVKMSISITEGYLGAVTGMSNNGANLTVSNITYEGNLVAKSSYLGGMAGRVQGGTSSFVNCRAKGNITGTSGTGGLIGDIYGTATAGCIVSIDRCSWEGTIRGTLNVAGILGKFTKASPNTAVARISNCFTTGDILCNNTYVAGISGDMMSDSSIRNCYSTCAIEGTFGLGGIVSRTCNVANLGANYEVNNNIAIEGCIAWNSYIKSVKDGGISPANNYSGGAVVGYSATKNTLKNCFRRPDMGFEYYADAALNTLTDHENADASNPLVKAAGSATYFIPYNGKAAAAGETVSSIAQKIGWDSSVWDFSTPLPTLK